MLVNIMQCLGGMTSLLQPRVNSVYIVCMEDISMADVAVC